MVPYFCAPNHDRSFSVSYQSPFRSKSFTTFTNLQLLQPSGHHFVLVNYLNVIFTVNFASVPLIRCVTAI